MKTYDASTGTHGSRPFLKLVKDTVNRFVDRERELVLLRNSVGMMAEARRADSAKYHEMAEALREARAKIHIRRHKVYESIDNERDYQDRKWGTVEQHPHEVGGWLTLMRKLLTGAEAAWAGSDGDYQAMRELRKVLAVGVACSEQHGLPLRSLTQPVSEKMRE